MNFRDYDAEALRAVSCRAGVASGAARRRKRAAIEREKIENTALREQRAENIRTICETTRLLLQCKRALEEGNRGTIRKGISRRP